MSTHVSQFKQYNSANVSVLVFETLNASAQFRLSIIRLRSPLVGVTLSQEVLQNVSSGLLSN